MDCTGKITKVEYHLSGTEVVLNINEQMVYQLNDLAKKDKLSFQIKQFRQHRSLDANAYFHVLVTSMADKLHTPMDEIKNALICQYGQYEYINGEIPTYLIKSSVWLKLRGQSGTHFKKISTEWMEGQEFARCAVMRGSHTYNTKEMATLIDGTVQEAKDLGIDTMTPDQIREMKERWGV